MIGFIYQILNSVDNKRYIGSTINFIKRKSQHKKELERNKHANVYLQAAYNKYGQESFSITKILVCEQTNLEFYEQLIIDGYKSDTKEFGYNLRKVSGSNRGMQTLRNTHKSGDKYNRLTLIEPREMGKHSRKWLVRCDCGNEIIVPPGDVRHNHTKSCGCLNKEKISARLSKWNKENLDIIQKRMKKIHEDFPEPWNKKIINVGGGQNALAGALGG